MKPIPGRSLKVWFFGGYVVTRYDGSVRIHRYKSLYERLRSRFLGKKMVVSVYPASDANRQAPTAHNMKEG